MQSMAEELGINGILPLVVILSFRLLLTIFFINLNLFIDILPGLFGVQLYLLDLKLFKLYVGWLVSIEQIGYSSVMERFVRQVLLRGEIRDVSRLHCVGEWEAVTSIE